MAISSRGGRPQVPAPITPPRNTPVERSRRRSPSVVGWALCVGLAASVALPLSNITASAWSAPGGIAIFLGDLTAMAGTFLLLVMVLLAARVPFVESVVGQDRLLRWHRRLAGAPITLLGAHAILTTLGSAESGRIGIFTEVGSLLTTMQWIFASLVAYAMFVAIAGLSIRAVRRKMNYDTWWVIHLYTYLALALSVPHQIFSGTDFVGHPIARAAWLAWWCATAGVVIVYRIGLPIVRSARHHLRLVQVNVEAPGVVSLIVAGRHLERLAVAGGQYFGWRFCTRDLWWHAHPFSLSAMPVPPYMRVTIQSSGDATDQIARLRPGTRIAVEGPFGAFTAARRTRSKVALIGAGVGITPLRALLEDLPDDVDIVVVQRASSEDRLLFSGELAELTRARRGRLVTLTGPRGEHGLDDPHRLCQLIPDLETRDVYICGPEAFAAAVERAARRSGVVAAAIHRESFEL